MHAGCAGRTRPITTPPPPPPRPITTPPPPTAPLPPPCPPPPPPCPQAISDVRTDATSSRWYLSPGHAVAGAVNVGKGGRAKQYTEGRARAEQGSATTGVLTYGVASGINPFTFFNVVNNNIFSEIDNRVRSSWSCCCCCCKGASRCWLGAGAGGRGGGCQGPWRGGEGGQLMPRTCGGVGRGEKNKRQKDWQLHRLFIVFNKIKSFIHCLFGGPFLRGCPLNKLVVFSKLDIIASLG
jgi:hypothetical protein